MLLAIIIVLISIPFLWWYLWLYKFKSLDVIPGPKPIPFIGNAHQIGNSPQELLKKCVDWFNQYGDLYKIYVGNELKVFISNADVLEQILNSNIHITKSDGYHLVQEFLNLGLLTSTGQKWKIRRKMITPTFHFKILDQFLEVFNSSGDILIEKLSQETKNDQINIYPYINSFSLDVVCETAMGVKISSQQGENTEFVTSLRDYLDIVMIRFFSSWKRFDSLFKFAPEYKPQQAYLNNLQKFTTNVIKTRRAEKSEEKHKPVVTDDGIKRKVALLDMLLESQDNNVLTDDDIKEEINTFLFEGHDTTSGISFTLLALANHLEIQDRVYEEIKNVVGDDLGITMQQLQEMKYLEMVLKEVQRLYCAVPFIERKLESDFNIKGINYPKDTTLTLFLYGVLHNEKYFPEPYKFDPDRFLLEEQAKRHTFAFVPFSAGPRNCIGQKFAMLDMKVTIIKILQNYQILAVPGFKPDLGMAAILKSYNGIYINLKKRSTNY